MTAYQLELTLDDVVELLNAFCDREALLAGRDATFNTTLAKLRLQLVAQGADQDLINDVMKTELPDVFT